MSDVDSLELPPLREQARDDSELDLPELSDAPVPLWKDVGKGVASGAAKGTVMLPGTVGSMGQIWDTVSSLPAKGIAKAAEKLGMLPKGKTYSDLIADAQKVDDAGKSEAEKKGYVNRVLGAPMITGAGMEHAAETAGMSTYDPKTPLGRMSHDVAEVMPSAIMMPGKTAAEKLLTTAASGTASAVAGEATRGTPYEMAARIVGSIVGGVPVSGIIQAVRARSTPAVIDRAMDIAGKAIRERYPDSVLALKNLKDRLLSQGDVVPGVKPTSAQVERVPAATSLENSAKGAGNEEAATLQGQKQASNEAVGEAANTVADNVTAATPHIDMKQAFGLGQGNAQLEASGQAHKAVQKVAEEYDRAQKSAWKALNDEGAVIDRNQVVGALNKTINSLDAVDKTTIPAFLTKAIDGLKQSPLDLSIETVQNLRSLIGKAKSAAQSADSPINAHVLDKFSKSLEDVLMDKWSYTFASDKGPALWDAARKSTRDFKQTFGDGIVGDIASGDVAGEGALQKLLSGDNAAQNLRAVKAIPGIENIDPAVENWLVGKLTSNGDKIDLKPSDVSKFMSDPRNAAIIREVPGVADRLMNIAQRAGENVENASIRQLNDRFQYVVGQQNPSTMANWLEKYGERLKSALPPDQADFVDQLHNSAKIVRRLPAPEAASTETYKNLLKNDMFTILYGRATGRIADAAEMGALFHVLSGTPGIGALVGAFGTARKWAPEVLDKFASVFFGGTQEQAMSMLGRAAYDPKYKALLMQRPNPDGVQALWDMTKKAPGTSAARAAIVTTPAEQDRQGRKSGGRVMNHAHEAQKLVNAAEKAKRFHVKRTETLLNTPDDAVTSALAIANRNI